MKFILQKQNSSEVTKIFTIENKWSFFLSVIVLCCLNTGCNAQHNNNDTWLPSGDNHTTAYIQDSLYIVQTINEFIRVEFDVFHYYHTFHVPQNKRNIYVDSIVYSPDSLKMCVLLVMKRPSIKDDESQLHVFTGHYLVGIRENTCNPWIIYRLSTVVGGVFYSYREIHKSMRTVLFDYFKDVGELNPIVCPDTIYEAQIYAVQSQKYVTMYYGKNLRDVDFWTEKNLLWRKSIRVKDYYNFQTAHHQATADRLVQYPKLEYPEYMITWYKDRCR
ncbi:MAG: hypothetical protein U0Y96_10425 [Candidatus Kapaibacterium sp.]